jgi:hypothetical protein
LKRSPAWPRLETCPTPLVDPIQTGHFDFRPTRTRLEDNLAGADLELGNSFTARLDEVTAPTPDEYPYGPFGEKQRGRYVDSSKQVISELF